MEVVVDKDGSCITEYKYSDWNEYIESCLISKCLDRVTFTPIFEGKEDETRIRSWTENILDYFTSDDLLDRIKLISAEHDDAYYVQWIVEKRIMKKKVYEYLQLYDDPELQTKAVCNLNDKSWHHRTRDLVFTIYHEDLDPKLLDHCVDEISENLVTHLNDKISQSIINITNNFKNNPIKAFLRFSYFEEHKGWSESYEMRMSVIEIYWMYIFSISHKNGRFTDHLHLGKINIDKIIEYVERNKIKHLKPFDTEINITIKSLMKIEKKHKKELEELEKRLKEQRQKEIEELLAPGGDAYLVAKDRFENNQKQLDELN